MFLTRNRKQSTLQCFCLRTALNTFTKTFLFFTPKRMDAKVIINEFKINTENRE